MAKSHLPPADYLRNLLRYDPETGKLLWKARASDRFPNVRRWKRWNTMFANAPALYTLHATGYLSGSIDGRTCYAHRVIWKMVHGVDAETIDHINGDRTDNRLSNLRCVSQRENCRNSSRHNDNISGVTGVSFYRNRWVATIWDGERNIYLGRFKNIEDARSARKVAEITYGFHPNHGRIRT
ncbi:HNH endonuclease [Sphingobium chungbukense]|uniref:HNH nuclease domain-containing protein n=1 Tax=Sphingobium chungbukense TaxID=56193 RepID=A0A0M3AUV5_9SPHN|nr:HNH endonuclease [Sphingobium chungbukense]KKW92676.1 hypothetical protein YP76_07010 [Sphingobium chungbukense]